MELKYYKVEKQAKPYSYDCPYNEGCSCTTKDCYNCGWNPIVAKIRMAKLMHGSREVTANG